jgi:hypothetical protein
MGLLLRPKTRHVAPEPDGLQVTSFPALVAEEPLTADTKLTVPEGPATSNWRPAGLAPPPSVIVNGTTAPGAPEPFPRFKVAVWAWRIVAKAKLARIAHSRGEGMFCYDLLVLFFV